MILNLGSLAFNANIANGGGTPTWGTELGQGEGYRFHFEDAEVFLTSMLYTSIEDVNQVTCPLGKGGSRRDDYEFVIASVYEKIYVNGLRVPDSKFVLLIVKQIKGEHHIGRRSLKYNPRISYRGVNYNEECYNKIPSVLGISNDAAWFVDEIYTNNQDELHFVAYVLNADGEKIYQTNEERKQHFISKINADKEINKTTRRFLEDRLTNIAPLQQIVSNDFTNFVWLCIKYFNESSDLQSLFESKYHGNIVGSYQGNEYHTINSCYVAQKGEDDSYESIKIYDGTTINQHFSAGHVTNFQEAINEFFKGKYRIDVIKNTDGYEYILYLLSLNKKFLPYLTALRTKPFMLLAGISGTGKSRIARQIAKACWAADSEERTKPLPSNFCMIQVKPNWHDSTELLGYVSRIEGEKYVAGKFLPFVAKAWENLEVPHILCLDEMNLAPVEQYFAEYLSVIESRKLNKDGKITTDPIIKVVDDKWYKPLVKELLKNCADDKIYALTKQFENDGITLPPNLFVIGTVNMDETTFSFSRKVLDRAMTIEMNEVDLEGGLTKHEQNELGEIGNTIIGRAVEGKDIYDDNKDYCDQVINYLKLVNDELENTPFKIAYRTRNEFLLYAVNRKGFDKDSSLETALDEMTSMKILPRIEGDSERVKAPLEALKRLMNERGWNEDDSVSLKKIKEMLTKLQQSGYTSYWT